MQTYVGYGFNVNDIEDKDWLELIRKYDPEKYKRFEESIKEECGEEHLEEDLLANVEEEIEAEFCLEDYLCEIINENEKEKAGTDHIVDACDGYLMFSSIRFLTDSKRVKYIQSESEFVKMISRYIPVKGLEFGDIYTGSEYFDAGLYMD